MKHIINTSEISGAVDMPEGVCEVCVSADANFDETARLLVVRLESFLRPSGLLVKERHFRKDWLPIDETVTERVGLDESGEVARDIFQRWARKVREAAPQLHNV